MRPADGKILFKEWLPDLPALDNPGLTEARNVIPVSATYRSYTPLQEQTASRITANGEIHGCYAAENANSLLIYVARTITATAQIYESTDFATLSNVTPSTTLNAGGTWAFSQYEDLIVAAGGGSRPIKKTLGSASSFTLLATSGTAPRANCIGVINQFVMVGNLTGDSGTARSNVVAWSGIDQPGNWPTPSSATAIAQQSGEQILNPAFGPVMQIFGNDQFGVILQRGGITRCTYVGGGTVFQFDEISTQIGSSYQRSAVEVGGLVYFASAAGFHVTDGNTVRPIGNAKVDRYFGDRVELGLAAGDLRICAAVDSKNKLIFWAFTDFGVGQGGGFSYTTRLLIYNYAEDRWSLANQSYINALCSYPPSLVTEDVLHAVIAAGLDSSGNTYHTLYTFTGTPGTATITTGELEPTPGGYARVQGIKPLVAATLNAVTVALGTRTDQETAPSYTSETTANSRTGFADFRTEARYVRARVTVTGTFNSAQGVEFQVVPSGAV